MPSQSDNTEPQTYKAHCHCGKVAFEFQHAPLESSTVNSCICSICSQRGYLFIYVEDMAKDFKFTKGSWDDMTEYRFGPKQIGHWFCPVCGAGLLENWEKDGKMIGGINVRCMEGVDLDSLNIERSEP